MSIVHAGSVYLNAEKVENNFSFCQKVTLLIRGKGEIERPILKDNVAVYKDIVVVNGITLHEECIVAANSVVIKDVSAKCLVTGALLEVIKYIKK